MIVIPMAGLSRRFADAGYTAPKYMLPLHGKSVFAHAVESFRNQFADERFLFVARDVAGTIDFVQQECRALGVARFDVVRLDHPTRGQAETVVLGLDELGAPDDEPVTIFNIDSFRRNFAYPTADWFQRSDGYLEVFIGSGPNWSYVLPGDGAAVRLTREKEEISSLCCDGLYHFRRAGDFRQVFNEEESKKQQAGELFVAPLYNNLIEKGKLINYEIIGRDRIAFCGVPAEYHALLQSGPAGFWTPDGAI